ncbi:hypothetical protein SAMN05660477_02731 [Soonwooa buanensis]|uniref:Uncharacterized protein n=1 Tax=Soonwooa buanensis TaxID=619805 RepID=A0A1T5GCW6_9FLAO|nr:hypothetical protein [Soonwooa buanensis]SKC06256.1 hypothetical protein SAMN05660477_02731 [Soonwooa buanensis]
MKKALQILFFLVSLFSFSQKTYNFDKELVYLLYKGDEKKNLFEESVFINSEDNSYFMKIFGSEGQKFALLYDITYNVRHDFDLIKNKEKGEIYFDFKFDRSINLNLKQKAKNPNFEFSSFANKRQLIIYKNDKRKSLREIITYSTKPTDKNLFFAFRAIALHPFELNQDFDSNENILVENAKIVKEKQTLNYELKFTKDVDLTLEIPAKN